MVVAVIGKVMLARGLRDCVGGLLDRNKIKNLLAPTMRRRRSS